MNKLNRFALMSAIALTGAAGFTACSSEDELANTNPTFDGESVKTQFAINIPYAKGQGTRMGTDIVQQNNNFRGIKDIYLVPTTGSAATTFSSIIDLGEITAFDNSTSTDPNYKVYKDVNIPTGTAYFHFYGEAKNVNVASDMVNGAIEKTLPNASSTGAIEFNLKQIYKNNGGTDKFSTGLTSMINVLNSVAAEMAKETSNQTVKDLYTSLQSMEAGSANSIKIAMENLYNALPSTATGVLNAIAGAGKPFTATPGTSGSTLAWNTGYDASFPTSIGLPEGTAQVEWSSNESKFVAKSAGGNSYGIKPENICYPAALYYYIGTNAKTKDMEFNDWSASMGSASDWDQYDWTANSWGSSVTSTTRTVALEDNVQYGVANLKTTVRCASATLEDNGAALGGAVHNVVVPSDGFPVTAIIVGGQPSKVGYNLEGVTGTTYDYNVYDSIPANNLVAKNESTTPSQCNYTLLLDDTKNTADGTHPKVYMAIELTNNSGTDFYGQGGIIPVGGKFYLIGELDPATATGAQDNKPASVFAKDYITTANLTIKSLKNAYVTIPDLRASKLELGLSVDLDWQNGLTFDVEIQ